MKYVVLILICDAAPLCHVLLPYLCMGNFNTPAVVLAFINCGCGILFMPETDIFCFRSQELRKTRLPCLICVF